MEISKKYTAIQIDENHVNSEAVVNLKYGDISGPYYDKTYPQTDFDTEEQAINWAYKENKRANWLILPLIKFIN